MLVHWLGGGLGEWLLTYAGARGGVLVWRKYNTPPRKHTTKVPI